MSNQNLRTGNLENQVQNNSQNIEFLREEINKIKKKEDNQEAINKEVEARMKKANERGDGNQIIDKVVGTVKNFADKLETKMSNNDAKMLETNKINEEKVES